jgi:hypothetical protein
MQQGSSRTHTFEEGEQALLGSIPDVVSLAVQARSHYSRHRFPRIVQTVYTFQSDTERLVDAVDVKRCLLCLLRTKQTCQEGLERIKICPAFCFAGLRASGFSKATAGDEVSACLYLNDLPSLRRFKTSPLSRGTS